MIGAAAGSSQDHKKWPWLELFFSLGYRPMELNNLSLKKERTLFWILATFSAIVWLATIVSLVGIIIGAIFALLAFFMNGLFIARIKSESVEVTQKQMPELYQLFLDACAKVQMNPAPRLYIMQHGGWLNAFATRFARRNFVVLFSDLVEALEPNSKELQFIIGHELGHIKQKHLTWGVFVAPGMLIPLLGSAYSRARESTCDRYGAFVAQDANASMRATLALAGGKQLYRVMDPLEFANQYHSERGFFISLHELLSTYPTMSKRVGDIKDFCDNVAPVRAPRNVFAYPFALFAFGPTTIILIYVAIVLFAVSQEDFAKAFKEGMAQKSARAGAKATTSAPALLKGAWATQDGLYAIYVDDNHLSFFSRCADDSMVQAPSTATFTPSHIFVASSTSQNKVIDGQECIATLQAGPLPYVLADNKLAVGEGENALNFERVEDTEET